MKNLKTAKANEARTKKAEEFSKKICEVLTIAVREEGYTFLKGNDQTSYAEIARFLNDKKIFAPRGGKWSRKQAQRIIERYKNIK